MTNIMIVEDDDNLRLLLSTRLKARYSVTAVPDAVQALELLEEGKTELVVTDIMMPVMDGYTFVRTMRSQGWDIPVIMLTAKDTLNDKGQGFSVGCDDYLTKPVNFEELVWRIDALLRRSKIVNEGKIVIGRVTVDSSEFTVTRGDTVIELPTKEFKLLYLLLSYPNKIFTKENILDKVWGYTSESDETTVRTHMNRLRSKFEGFPEFELVTIRGVGYKAVIKK
ncbi:MAG TPA: DNA-binding response regulator [Clostridiales bacterium]|nr:DNA-binding response regulator [Clostridiales bacterium]